MPEVLSRSLLSVTDVESQATSKSEVWQQRYWKRDLITSVVALCCIAWITVHLLSRVHIDVSPLNNQSNNDIILIPSSSPRLIEHIGVCLSGLEWGQYYRVPTVDEYLYFKSKRLTLIRLPFKWEILQPKLNGPLDETYLGILKSQVAIAASLNMTVLLDCHNYARYNDWIINGTSGNLTNSMFADLWRRLASEFVGSGGLHGYDIMNEPNTMPSLYTWPSAAQAAIDAIRTVDKVTPVHLEGNHWSSCSDWENQNPGFPLHDPLMPIVYSCHLYIDRDGSGTHFNWEEEEKYNVTIHTGEERLQSFLRWKAKYKAHGHLGEMGIGFDNQGWFEALNLTLQLVAQNEIQFTYWSAGPGFAENNYPMGVDVGLNNGVFQDKMQMAVLDKFSGAISPSVYFLSGPSSGLINQPANFTLDVRGYLMKPIMFRCFDGISAEPFTRMHTSTVFNALMNFSFTPNSPIQYQIYCSNDARYLDAPSIAFVVSKV